MKSAFLILGILLLVSISFAAKTPTCVSGCNSSYTREVQAEQSKLTAKSYYCGYTDTNCWSREGVTGSDPCWSMCSVSPFNNDAFQSCCFQSAQMNAQRSFDQCVAACPEATPNAPVVPTPNQTNPNQTNTTAPIPAGQVKPEPVLSGCLPRACQYSFESWAPWPDCECMAPLNYWEKVKERYTMKVNSISGTVWIKKNGKSPKILLTSNMKIEPGDIIATSEGGAVTIERELPAGGKQIETLSQLQTLQSVAYCAGKPCNLNDIALLGGIASSEHSSIRGTINGGGDFIMIPVPLEIGLADIIPPNNNKPVMTIYELSNDGTHDSVYLNMSGKLIQVKATSREATIEVYENVLRDTVTITATGTATVGVPGEIPVVISEGQATEANSGGVGVPHLRNEPSPQPFPNPCCASAGILLLLAVLAVRRS